MMKPIYKDKDRSPAERAGDLISRMSVREKAGQLNQRLYGFASYERTGNDIVLTRTFTDEVKKWGGLGVLYGLYRADPWSGRNFDTGITNRLVPRVYNLIQRYVVEHSRFGIPVLMSSESPHGHQALDGYLLPVSLAMGATFNVNLVESAFGVCAGQMADMGVDLALISVLDVLRDPRWGRSEECYGEDPILCARMAAAAVKGVQSNGVAAVAKHFCAQGEGTGGINASAARIGERELREIHLPPAKACCQSQIKCIMAAYNEIDGIPCHGNAGLLNGILRGEMGFEGIVMADGTAVDRLDIMTGDNVKSGALALSSGVDVSLWDNGFTHLEEALSRGYISEKSLDEAVSRVLRLKFERGLFERPYLKESIDLDKYTYDRFPQSLELARQSLVLLKNSNQLLPLDNGKLSSVAVIGPNADSLYNQLGDYTPPQKDGNGVTMLQGLRALVPDVDFLFERGCDISGNDVSSLKKAVEAAKCCDLVILALGGSSSRFSGAKFENNGAAAADGQGCMDCGEGVDCACISLGGMQEKLAQAIFDCGKPVVTVLIQGRPYAVEAISRKTGALICSFYPGPMGGQALAELIFGKSVPSGRMPVSVPRSASQLPVYYNYKASYDAMRYHNEKNTPLFSFGFGLNYTDIEYSDFRLSRKKMPLRELLSGEGFLLRFKVKNKGGRDGFAVPLLYLHDVSASTTRRVRELKAFRKVFLQPSEEQSVLIEIKTDELSIWNREMIFTVENGDFELMLSDFGEILFKDTITVVD